MAYYLIEDSTLTDIGNAIREKTGKTNMMSPSVMANEIRNINNSNDGSGSAEEATVNLISQQIHINSIIQGSFVTLLSGNAFVSENYNKSNLFIILTPNSLDEISSDDYSSNYQWTSMFATNSSITANEDDVWYGAGVYLMLGKGYSYPSTLEIPYSLNDTSHTNYSYLNATADGDIRAYICGYDVLASGDYTLAVGLL